MAGFSIDMFFEYAFVIASQASIFIVLLSIHLNAVSQDYKQLRRGICLSSIPAIFSGLIPYATVDYDDNPNFNNLLMLISCVIITLIFISLSIYSSIMLMRENSPDANENDTQS